MKKIIAMMILFTTSIAFSQVGIGTTSPDSSSMLDITTSSKGLLIPRVNLTSISDVTTIPNPAVSLLVYNKTNGSGLIPGFYYWDSQWKLLEVASSTSTDWSLSGNSITSDKFLGTTNNQSLIFKVANTERAKFDTSSNMILGFASNITPGVTNATIIGNQSNVSSPYSFVLGYQANVSGQASTAIGYQSTASVDNATAIGYQSIATQANSIILGSSTNVDNKVGIGTNTPDERLHIVGSVKIVDGNQGAGKVLTSDANGKGTWTDVNTNKLYGEINLSSSTALTSGKLTLASSGVGNGVTLSTTNIQVQKKGLYKVSYRISLKKNSSGSISPEFYLANDSGIEYTGTRAFATLDNGNTRTVSVDKLINLNARDKVAIFSTLSDSNTNLLANGCNLVVELIK
ncbi:hypothetical protein ACFO3U_10455 [Flavobacterium ponti]|uniref:Trimeric autotransporter adhesin YadA-like head domain-containing protein n=1 Tax=Flavobacterium ponti TaxID=665133 RepID=A0ABV9P8V8_9FLAO